MARPKSKPSHPDPSVPTLISSHRVVRLLRASLANKRQMLQGQRAHTIAHIAGALIETLRSGHRIYIMGNGGSAADAQHFAAELVGRFKLERKGLPAIALTTDTSALTAIGNDYGFDSVFARQVEALAQPGDAVLGITTSGNSPNVLRAIERAQQIGALTIGFTGPSGGRLAELCPLCLKAPGTSTDLIQECHITVIHILCHFIEQAFFTDRSEPLQPAR